MRHLPVVFRYIAGEPSEINDEAIFFSCGKLQKTEQIESVPDSVPSRERLTDRSLALAESSHIWFLAIGSE
jgi:hypothetical protein